MKIDLIEKIYGEKLKIPETLESAILGLYNVNTIEQIEKNELIKIKNNLTMFNNFKDYNGLHKEYTLYYLLVNLYKIWRPLVDLLYVGQINSSIKVLELGVGPGSSTFGIMEFYKSLSIDNPNINFRLDFKLIEKEKIFIDIFNKVFVEWNKSTPSNLKINIQFINFVLDKNFNYDNLGKNFDFIVESNMLNPNEKIDKDTIKNLFNNAYKLLNKHGSIILIEPAEKKLLNYFNYIKDFIKQSKIYNIFSPCCCNNKCNQLAMAKSFIPYSNILYYLRKEQIIQKQKEYHFFEYLILRQDSLEKYHISNNTISLNNIGMYIGKEIRFSAFILMSRKTNISYRLKICDKTLIKNEVWLEIPDFIFKQNNLSILTINRGSIISVSKAIIYSNNEIKCNEKTRIQIMR